MFFYYKKKKNIFFISFFFGTKRGQIPREKKLRNYPDISRHASPGNIIKPELLKLSRRSLQNDQIQMIHINAKISKPIGTSISFAPSMVDLHMSIHSQQLPDTMN